MIFFNDRRKVQLSKPNVDTYGEKLPGGLKPRTMKEWNARANVIAAAKGGSIKAAEPPAKVKKRNPETGALNTPVAPGKERVFKVNRPMTRALVGKDGGAIIGKEVDVKKGSRKAARLKKRAERYRA